MLGFGYCHQRFFLFEISKLATKATGTARTEISAVAPAVMLLLSFFFSRLFSLMVVTSCEVEGGDSSFNHCTMNIGVVHMAGKEILKA